jgi:chlorobactene glucosyltransferase
MRRALSKRAGRSKDAWTMDILALSCSLIWLLLVAMLIIRAARQRGQLPVLAPTASLDARAPTLAVIVPARDEAANIGPCLRTLLEQDYPAERCSILVVDDQSVDATPNIVAAMSREDKRLRLLRSPPLPAGWTGKSHACWLGARAVAPGTEWLCFIDADMRGTPSLLASALQSAQRDGIDLLMLAPRHVLRSFAERLVIPCGLFVLAFLQNLGARQVREAHDVIATGQFMVIRTDAYETIGGHAAVRAAISEDLELARRCKRSDRVVLLMDGQELLSGRMYTGWRTLWPGFAKNLVDLLGGPLATAVTATVTVMLAWAALAVPALAAVRAAQDSGGLGLVPLALSITASAALFALHIAGAIYFRIPFWYGLLFPIGYTAGALIAADSIRQRWQARVTWKGRVYS